VNMMYDDGHPSSLGLCVEQHWYMNTENEYDDWAIGVLDFCNDARDSIIGLYVGLLADFDVGASSNQNIARSDTVRRAVYMQQASSENPTTGIVLLAPTDFANLAAIDHAVHVYPDSCVTDGQKYRMLTGDIGARQSNRSYDWSVVASAGPFDLAMGGHQRVAFAIVGATSGACWNEAADNAQDWYNANLLGIEENPDRIAAGTGPGLFLVPNPFHGGTFLHYFAGAAGTAELTVYDAAGREAERLIFEVERGSGSHYWQPKALARGVYFLRLKTPDGESTVKMLMMD